MGRKVFWGIGLVAAVASLAVAGIAASATGTTKLDTVTVQLKWVTQAQFAGYYAAAAQGYYKANGLDVKIKVGGPSITPEQVVASGQAQFGLDWLPSLLAARDQGGKLLNIAQVFGSSGMTELTWKSSGLTTIKSLAKKKVGVWCCGNQFELYAALTKNGINPNSTSAVTIVNQPFDMNLFLQKKVDAAAAMTYNELAQVLETKNPATGQLYKLSDLNVLKMQAQGTGMLEDGVFVNSSWIGSAKNQDIAKRFLAATFQGWAYCRDHAAACVNIVLQNGPTLGKGHQTWQMNEINALIWPAPKGIGIMVPAAFNRTAAIAKQYGVIKKLPSGAYRTDIAAAAVAMDKAKGVDVTGLTYKKAVVAVTPGGK